ncbi:MAG: alpha/beta fold hydrolase [Methylococcales bacterium]|nr:alpha/beta fold hydrolase [Methylococcales bacterium]
MSAITLAFESFGKSDQPALIILHGFFASSRNWRQMARKLADNHHVYVLDLRNHGLSAHSSVMDYPSMVDDLALFMDEQGLEKANILGHSMGGKVAMWFVLNYPERVNKLIVADISPVAYQHSFDQTIQALIDLPLDKISNRKQADEFLSAIIPELAYRQFLLQNLQLVDGQYSWRIDLETFYHNADNIIGFPSVELVTAFIDEVLFVMGGNSNYTDTEAIKHSFPNAKIMAIEGASHWLHVDSPDKFFSHSNDFLEKK